MFPILNFLPSQEGRRKQESGIWKSEEWTRYLYRKAFSASEGIGNKGDFATLPLSPSPPLPLSSP
ncbi:MAG: hypothetical protein ABI180_10315 [Microcoleus sp.]